MVLEPRVRDDLEKHHFSEPRLRYWLSKGLNMDVEDEMKRTLLMRIVSNADEQALQFVINQGVNVNAQNSRPSANRIKRIELQLI